MRHGWEHMTESNSNTEISGGRLAADSSCLASVPNPGDGDVALLDHRLVQSRLGIQTSLFFALRAKHPPTAAHCLRVALGCSKWSNWRQMSETDKDLLEVASLLHDIGKIGVPDEVLQKPERLSEQEQLVMETERGVAEEILSSAGANHELASIVQVSKLDFQEASAEGIASDLASMLAIVDAFDSMTTEQEFRRAMSRDRALEELFINRGTQFDPRLVEDFAVFTSQPRRDLELALKQRWLGKLAGRECPGFQLEGDVGAIAVSSIAAKGSIDSTFHHRLLDSLSDAAIYLDREGKILSWNRVAETLTGRQASSLVHRRWTWQMMGLRDMDGMELAPEACPLKRLMATNTQVQDRYRLQSVLGREFIVHLRAIPVFSNQREQCGVILLVRDTSRQATLERKVQSLHAIASMDPLTKVANRAELASKLPRFLSSHLEEGRPGSMIICDIDFFKNINDTYGHQAGDEALVTFAGLLRETAREDDLVARYGGEEFIIICHGCDNASATIRAEQMREAIQKTPVPALKGRNMTSSFGVTEIQPGDTEETLLARADRALMMAKENGRNRVVQLGSGQDGRGESKVLNNSQLAVNLKSSWLSWFSGVGEAIARADYLAAVPQEVAIQKLEGFINDHNAELISIEQSRVVIRVGSHKLAVRRGERPTCMIMNVEIKKVEVQCANSRNTAYQSRTMFRVSLKPYRARDRRSDSIQGQATQLMLSIKSYLVAQEVDDAMRAIIIEPR